MRALVRLSSALALVAVLGACAGGGGGGGSAPVTPTPDPPAPPPPPPPPPPPVATNPSLPLNPPSTTSSEYRRNFGLAAIQASAGYAVGATGKGVIVGVIDDGYDLSAPDLQGAYSSKSTDIVGGRSETTTSNRHGVRIAGIIASRFNGLGTIGVAYESTILAVRADSAPDPSCTEKCGTFASRDTARGLDYAVANGARVINMSFGSEDASGSTLQSAMQRAIAAGSVLAISAGNDGEAESSYPARFAGQTPYQGGIIAVGATGPDGTLASFSNRAGSAAQYYLTAPGSEVVTDCGSDGSCWRVGGTSFAAPHVAGALALLLQYFPNISGRDAVQILLRTADDKGDPGTDPVYGRGAMNLARAFDPVGVQALRLSTGAVIDLPSGDVGSALGGAFGDAVARSAGLTTVIEDDYHRRFGVDLADGYRRRQRTSALVTAEPAVRQTAQTIDAPHGALVTLAAAAPMFPDLEENISPARAFLRPEPVSSAMASVRLGGLDFTAWRGHGAVAAPSGPGGHNAFASLAASDRTVAAVWRAGAFSFAGEGGWAERRTPLSVSPVDATTYAALTTAYGGRDFALSLSAGALDEPRGALGSEFDVRSPLTLAARTRFAAVGLDRELGPLTLRAEAAVGRTAGGGQLVDVGEVISSSWRLALAGDCGADLPCDGFGLELAQPLRVESGVFRAVLADMPANYDDPITFSERRFSAAPSRREIDLRLHADRMLGLGTLRLEAGAAFNPAHESGEAELGVSAAWRTSF